MATIHAAAGFKAAICVLMLAAFAAGDGALAQTTSSDLVEKLKSSPRMYRRAAPPADTTVIERAFRGTRTRGVRGITVEERAKIAAIAHERPSIDMEIHFDYDSAAITPQAETVLKELGEALTHRDLRDDRFIIAGHTDAKGSADYNQGLSERRAEAVRRYLLEKYLLSPDRLLAIGYGFEQLKVPSDPFAAANRRVQVANFGAAATPAADTAPPRELSPGSGRSIVRRAADQPIDGALDEIAPHPQTAGAADGESSSGPVSVAITPGTTVRLDDIITVRVTSRIAGNLMIYEEDSTGQVTQIFPNSLSTGSRPGEARATVAAGETVVVPGPMDRFQLRVSPPVGTSRIIAIVLPERVKVDDLTRPNADMQPISNPGAMFQTLARRATRGVRVEPSERAVVVLTYKIVP